MRASAERGQPGVRAPAGWDRLDTAIVVVFTVAAVLVHPLGLVFGRSYWFDESWVAAVTRAPLSRLIGLGSPAPVGFIALLKTVPGSAPQRARLVPLVFTALTVAMAYVLTRLLRWSSRWTARIAAVAAAFAVMLAPFMLKRDDLKQYTCDAFCALLILTLAAAVDRTHRRAALVWLVVASVAVTPFSSTAAFVAIAAFAGLIASAALRRSTRDVVEIGIAGAVAGLLLGAYFASVVIPNVNSALTRYWMLHYLSGSVPHMVLVTWRRLSQLATELAIPAALFVALFALGVVVLARMREWAVAIAIPALWLEIALLSRLHKYPFLDERTSTFLLVCSLVVVVIGIVALVDAVTRLLSHLHPWAGRLAAVAVAATLVSLYLVGASVHFYEFEPTASENVRAETRYVGAHRRPTDVVLVDNAATYGFSFYWPHGGLAFRHNDSAEGYVVRVLGIPSVYVPARNAAAVLASLREAVGLWRRAPAGSRLYIVRTHLTGSDVNGWHAAFQTLGLKPHAIAVGVEDLLVLGPR